MEKRVYLLAALSVYCLSALNTLSTVLGVQAVFEGWRKVFCLLSGVVFDSRSRKARMAHAIAACRSTAVLSTSAVTATDGVPQPWTKMRLHTPLSLSPNLKKNKNAHMASTTMALASRPMRDLEPSR
jgi:hypothetical protein